jgi:hypothetical protein
MCRLTLDAQPTERVTIENDSIRTQHCAKPQSVVMPINFAAVALRYHRIRKPVRMQRAQPRVHEPAGVRLTIEIVGAAAKEHIDPAAHVRCEKGSSRLFDHRERIRRKSRALKARLNFGAPRAAEFARPIIFERGYIFSLEETRDVTRSSHHTPVDRHRTARFRAIPFTESARELVTNRFVVRRDDDDSIICLAWRDTLRSQHKRQRDDREQGKNYGDALQTKSIIEVRRRA